MKTTLLALFISLISISANAQIAFVKGYIVNEKGDTVRGEVKINPKKEQDKYNKVFFKDESGMQKNLKPNKVKAYGFEKHNYITMDYEGEPKFYRALVRGEISLYKMMFEVTNMNATSFDGEYFIIRSDEKKMVTVKEGKFKKQLQEMMSGAAGYASDYEGDKKLNEEKAVEVITKYNTRSGND